MVKLYFNSRIVYNYNSISNIFYFECQEILQLKPVSRLFYSMILEEKIIYFSNGSYIPDLPGFQFIYE